MKKGVCLCIVVCVCACIVVCVMLFFILYSYVTYEIILISYDNHSSNRYHNIRNPYIHVLNCYLSSIA